MGFTVAEGSFGLKSSGSAFFSIKQKGVYNYNIIKAICLLVAEREAKPIKADSLDCYQLTLSSKSDVQKVVNFFSSTNNTLSCEATVAPDINWFSISCGSISLKQVIDIKRLKSLWTQLLKYKTEINFYGIIKNIFCLKCKVISFLTIFYKVVQGCKGAFWQFIIRTAARSAGRLAASGLLIIDTSFKSMIYFYRISHPISFLRSISIKDHKKIKGDNKKGPHNKEILSIIFGSLLGKGTIEIKKDGSCITFFQEAKHVKYLL